MHLLMASFRALPLDLMMPLSRRRIVWKFVFSYFCPPFFKFFLCSFSLTFSIQTRCLSSVVSAPFAHAHIATLAGRKWQQKFGATFASTRCGSDTRQTWTVFQKVAVPEGRCPALLREGGDDRNISPIRQSLCFPLIETLP